MLVLIEILFNLLLCIIDLCFVIDVVYRVGVKVVVDNIFLLLVL